MDFTQQIAQYIITGLTIGAIYAIVAMGFNIIHNATGIVNFAQCEFISLGGMFMYSLVVLFKINLFISFFISMAGVALIGALIEIGPIRHARSKEIIILIFLTIGLSEIIRGAAQEVWGTDNVGVFLHFPVKVRFIFWAEQPSFHSIFGLLASRYWSC